MKVLAHTKISKQPFKKSTSNWLINIYWQKLYFILGISLMIFAVGKHNSYMFQTKGEKEQ